MPPSLLYKTSTIYPAQKPSKHHYPFLTTISSSIHNNNNKHFS